MGWVAFIGGHTSGRALLLKLQSMKNETFAQLRPGYASLKGVAFFDIFGLAIISSSELDGRSHGLQSVP
jgi:hypothetical protein